MFRTFRIKRRVHKAVPNLDYKIVGIHVRRVKGSLLRCAWGGITAELAAGFAVISLLDTETIKPAQLSSYGQLLERETTRVMDTVRTTMGMGLFVDNQPHPQPPDFGGVFYAPSRSSSRYPFRLHHRRHLSRAWASICLIRYLDRPNSSAIT